MWAVVVMLDAILCYLSFLTKTFFLDTSSPSLCRAHPSIAIFILDPAFARLLSLHPFPSQSHSVGESLVYCSTQPSSLFRVSNSMALISTLFLFQLIIFTSFYEIQKKRNLTVGWRNNSLSHIHLAIQNNLPVCRCTAYLWKDF